MLPHIVSNHKLITHGVIAILLQLTFVVFISIGLCKLQGQVVTHFEKVVWWKSFMVDCVTFFHTTVTHMLLKL